MEAFDCFITTTDLHRGLKRINVNMAVTIAALVIAKLIDGYLFCGFNANFFVDQPVGIILFVGCCVMPPLLRWAFDHRHAATNCARICLCILGIVVCIWYVCSCIAAAAVFLISLLALGSDKPFYQLDPFNVCNNRSIGAVKAEFSNAMPTFEVVQRVDIIFKLFIAIGWLYPAGVSFLAHLISIRLCDWITDACSNAEWYAKIEEVSGGGKFSVSITRDAMGNHVFQRVGTNIEDKSTLNDATRDAEERKSEVCSVDVRMENLRNEINEPGSNAEPQFEEANEPEFSIVDEEEGTAATATMEASN